MTEQKTSTHKFDAQIDKVLQLMIHSLYTNKDIFLRELISNASDACDKLRYQMSTSKIEGLQEDQELKITVKLDKETSTITIKDNGIGMSRDEMIANLGTIASSGTQRFLTEIEKNPNQDVSLIGQFGVGFYSAFMVASDVTVISKKVGQDQTFVWSSAGDGNYSISEQEEGMSLSTQGTTVMLRLNEKEIGFLEKYKIQHVVKTYSDHVSFPIELQEGEDEPEILNEGSALWMKSKSEITQEQYEEFYKHVSHSPDKPWHIMHNKVEGTLEYNSLLYIPSAKPFDLFDPARKTRVKLYIKRVFITDDNVKLVPEYMRFLRGVVDSQDLPLNISRETLQDSLVVNKIRRSIVKKILSSFKKKATDDAEGYAKFWDNFGEVMKEGLCEGALEEKEQLLEVCRFKSLKSDQKLISLDQYIDQMAETQEEIVYITGDNHEKLLASPQLEGFKERNIDVLLLCDHVDDFWVNVINQYKGKDLKSAASASPGDKKDENQDAKDKESSDAKDTAANDNGALITYVSEVLKDDIKDARISSKLTNSPACLCVAEGSMSSRMEKYLIEQKQLHAKSKKILEINATHPLIKKIAHNLKSQQNEEDNKNLVRLIFEQACIIEGEGLDDPSGFAKRMNLFLDRIV